MDKNNSQSPSIKVEKHLVWISFPVSLIADSNKNATNYIDTRNTGSGGFSSNATSQVENIDLEYWKLNLVDSENLKQAIVRTLVYAVKSSEIDIDAFIRFVCNDKSMVEVRNTLKRGKFDGRKAWSLIDVYDGKPTRTIWHLISKIDKFGTCWSDDVTEAYNCIISESKEEQRKRDSRCYDPSS